MSDFEFMYLFEHSLTKYGVHLMHNESFFEQELFLSSFYRSFGHRIELDLNWFNWYYIRNPYGLCNNYILIDLDKGTWIGGFGFAKIPYEIQGITRIGGLAINGYINPGYEGNGLYNKLISIGLQLENIKDEMYFSFPHSFNVPSIKGHIRSGWQYLMELIFIERKVESGELNYSEIECLDNPEELKNLDFALFNGEPMFKFHRNFDFLFWRFIARPNRAYIYLLVESNEEMGYMILGFYEKAVNVRRCQIADYRYTSEKCLKLLINKAYNVAIQNGCQVLDVLINAKSAPYELFLGEDFHPRLEGYNLLTYSNRICTIQPEVIVTYGDFDAV